VYEGKAIDSAHRNCCGFQEGTKNRLSAVSNGNDHLQLKSPSEWYQVLMMEKSNLDSAPSITVEIAQSKRKIPMKARSVRGEEQIPPGIFFFYEI
jgi:hypothetical protein